MNEDPLLARFVGARMRDVKRQSRAEARYLCPCHPWHSAVPTDQRMSTFLIQIVLLAGGAVYFGWTAAGALRSGEISVYVRANRGRQFSRRANPAGRWTVVFLISRRSQWSPPRAM